MNQITVTFSTGVASVQHPSAQTLTKPVMALRDRIARIRALLNPAPEFLDPSYQGTAFISPARERRQEVVAARGVKPAAVYSPNWLARQAADQIRGRVGLPRAGRRLLGLNRPVGDGLEPADTPVVPWRRGPPRPSPWAIPVMVPVPAVTSRRPL